MELFYGKSGEGQKWMFVNVYRLTHLHWSPSDRSSLSRLTTLSAAQRG